MNSSEKFDEIQKRAASYNPEYRFVRDKAEQPFPFEFATKQHAPGVWHATTPYRQIVWGAPTEEEAIGMMVRGFAELGRAGSVDPANPYAAGDPPLQHAINILTDSLAWHVARRREQIDANSKVQSGADADSAYDQLDPSRFGRLNEIISGLATSVAALARVKEL